MHECNTIPGAYGRTVGDPVDVVTGANLDVTTDFQLIGPLKLNWHRYYDSSQHRRPCALGWGHTHEYDRRLEFDVDGVRYVSPVGKAIGFPPLLRDGDEFTRGGVRLRRVEARVYQAHQRGEPAFEFHFRDGWPGALLIRAFQGADSLRFHYGPAGYLEGLTDSLGRKVRVEHDRRGRVLGLTLAGPTPDKDRRLLTCRYDAAGNLVEGVDAYKNAFRFRYDADNRMTAKTDRRGYTFHFEYDTEGRCVHSAGQDGLHEVRLRYLAAERITYVTKADGGEWAYFYDPNKALTQVIDPLGGVTQYRLDDQGRLAEEVDPNGNVSRMVYDGAGGLTGKITPLGDFVAIPEDFSAPRPRTHRVANCPLEWEYGDLFAGRPITLPPSDDPVLRRLPSFALQLIRTVSPQRLGFDASPNAPEPGRHATADGRVYDDLGLLLSQTLPEGGARRWTYNANGNIVRYCDADGSTSKYEYTSWNLPSRVNDPLGRTVSYRFTPSGQLSEVTDAGGTVSEFAFDRKDRLTRVSRHGEVKDQYRYDQADNLVAKLDGRSQTLVTLEVGPANQKKAKRLSSGEEYTFSYDDRGRLLCSTGGDFEVSFAYDAQGRRTQDLRDGRGVKHRFDCRGRSETTYFDHFTVRCRRNKDDALVIEDPGGRRHTVVQLEHGLVVRTLSNGSREVSQYNDRGNCLVKVHLGGRPTAPLWSRTYLYSAEGDLLEVQDSLAGTARYAYDSAHRLVGVQLPGGEKQNFVYDNGGNLLQQPGLEDVAMRDGNRLLSVSGDRFDYNDRGHVASRQGPRGDTRYHYDASGMLTRCETVHGVWHARYDPLGRRIAKWFGDHRVEYFWDTDRLAAEVNEAGRVRLYVYADRLALVPLMLLEYDSVDADPASGRRYFVFCNQIGAPVLVEDGEGRQVWSARLDPYGKAHVDPGSSLDMPLRFPGHYWDEETGLHYNRFRYYSPELGRYLQSDPIGLDGGFNVYAYPASPLTQADVRGLLPPCTEVERRVWSEEELAEAERLIKDVLQPAPLWRMQEMGRQPVELSPRQQALHDALRDPANRSGGTMVYPFSRIPMGEPINVADLHALTMHTGFEHGVVIDKDGRVMITRGDPNAPGTDPDADTTLVHTHPHQTPPSPGDLQYSNSPQGSAIVGPDGRVTDYNEDGQNPHATTSPIADDGTIDGNHHPINPIVTRY
jgi:RHS repeat-associated protein